jgi:endonuclease-3
MTEKLLDKKKAAEVVERLGSVYGDEGTALVHGNTFELLICVVLSAQTTDVSVNKVTPELFKRWPDAAALAAADPAEVSEVIRTIGLYRTKAANIVKLAGLLSEKYGGEAPGDFDALVSLPGVGRKTANVVLAFGFGQERMPVDTHVFRVANRIGLCCESTVEKTEAALVSRIPKGRLSASHHYLIFHGRRVCHARKPDCGGCVIRDICVSQRNSSVSLLL